MDARRWAPRAPPQLEAQLHETARGIVRAKLDLSQGRLAPWEYALKVGVLHERMIDLEAARMEAIVKQHRRPVGAGRGQAG